MDKKFIMTAKLGPLVASISKITTSTGLEHEPENKVVALCRCGESSTKPFCDGSHGMTDFDDSKSEKRTPRFLESYVGKEITIHDDRGICSHAGYCTDGLPKVFRMGVEPWIDPNGESVENIIKTIQKCPSGALSYSIDGIKIDNYSSVPRIKVTEDGPYVISGDIEIKNDDRPQTENHYALCRCGHSGNKPYCNGQHWYVKFRDEGIINKKSGVNKNLNKEMDNKYSFIRDLSEAGKSKNSSMRTLMQFPDFGTLLFKGAQLEPMPYNEDVEVNLKTIIGKNAKKPLELSIPFYVSHMSYGALSKEAKIALAKGTTLVDTVMCSGEGGMLPESRLAAKKYIYELGTAAFSHKDEAIKQADAVELKIGQAVKPGLGGHLPYHKTTPEIAKMRGLKHGEESFSPGRMSGVDSIQDLIDKVKHIRRITDGVPVGIKFSAGHIEEDLEKVLLADPDFITIDCRGGATGSALEFLKDNACIPPIFAIRRARRYLDSVKSDVTLCVTGGFRDSSDIAKGIALGADAVALATASLISIGCLQSRVCHTGTCPSGIATQDEALRKLFDEEKALKHFKNFYKATSEEIKTFVRSSGKKDVHHLNINDILTISNEVSMNSDISHI